MKFILILFFYIIIIVSLLSCNQHRNEVKNTNDLIDSTDDVRYKSVISQKQFKQNISDTTHCDKYIYYNCSMADCATMIYYLDKNYLKQPSRKNILYYYKRLFPFFIFSDDFAGFQNLINKKILPSFYENKITSRNLANGYLEFYGYPEEGKEYEKSKIKRCLVLFRSNKEEDYILLNYQKYRGLSVFLLDENNRTWNNSFAYTHPKHGQDRMFYSEKLLSSLDTSHYYFKLPEYSTTILACHDQRDFIEDTNAFWEDKLKNHPEEIIYLDWDAEEGKFEIKK